MTEPESSEERARPGFFVHVVPAVLYVVAVFYTGAARISVPVVETWIQQDKVMHFLVFGGMVFVIYHALAYQFPKWSRLRLIVASAVTSSVLGALLELFQLTIPYRDAELMDWVADTLGAILAAGILRLRKPRPPASGKLEPAQRK